MNDSFEKFTLKIASPFWPELRSLSKDRRLIGVGDVLSSLYAVPLAVIGVVWLISATNLKILQAEISFFALFLVLILIFNRLQFFFIVEIRANRFGTVASSFSGMIEWIAILLFGPTAIWLSLIWPIYEFLRDWLSSPSTAGRWGNFRTLSLELANRTLIMLLTLSVYQSLGGMYPFPGISPVSILLGMTAILVGFVLSLLLWSVYTIYHSWVQVVLSGRENLKALLQFFLIGFTVQYLVYPFSILAAGLYVDNGLFEFLFFLVGILITAILARQMSWAVESSRQQARELEQLEQLSRASLESTPERDQLTDNLANFVPMMFPSGKTLIWLFPNQILLKEPEDWTISPESMCTWLMRQDQIFSFRINEPLPWEDRNQKHNPLIIAPIRDTETGEIIGGILLDLHTLVHPWDQRALNNLKPGMQALAAVIASALRQEQLYTNTLQLQRVSQELKTAGSIQFSLLPYSFPNIPGWQMAVTYKPVGETSGDFYDVINLPDGKVGLVIADVVDKGVGPALYMAISRTLLRTYAYALHNKPENVLFATNQRILQDTRANLFVTIFFGILQPSTGELVYCNAGHHPPLIVGSSRNNGFHELGRTGIPVGIEEDARWDRASISIKPGETMVLYTDGIPDAQNEKGEFYTLDSFQQAGIRHHGNSAEIVQNKMIDSVQAFVGDAPQFDDITLMVLVRE